MTTLSTAFLVFACVQFLGVCVALRFVRVNRTASLRPPRVPREFVRGDWKHVP
jgi:hypothetical protein